MTSVMDIEERAAHWLVRRQEPEWSAADQAALDAWLRESTSHEVAFLRLEYGWSKVDRLSVLRRPPLPRQECAEDMAPALPNRRPRRLLLWGAAAAAVLLSVGILFLYGDLFAGDVYTTAVGGHEIVPLADGSRIELNTNTRVRTRFAPEVRSVWLDRGEAYFEVARDPARPFVVYAGDRRVTVLGTKFSVRLDADAQRVQLAVAEGRVQLEELRGKEPAPPLIATGGDTVIAEGTSMRVEPRSAETVSTELSWRQGLLTFDHTTLATAVQEFNRYNRKRLVVEPSAADIRIGGSFEAANIDGFTQLLQDGFGLQVVESDGEIRISE
jgi:transmembrane sensor